MAFASATISFPSTSVQTFREHLATSKRTVALLGAGLSASSGLATYRGVGADGLWKGHELSKLSNAASFDENPRLVWDYQQDRRQQMLDAQPNAAHHALATFAKVRGAGGFMALSTNIDGLCARAGHPGQQLLELHGSLFDLKCTKCDLYEAGNFDPKLLKPITSTTGAIDLPQCPGCKHGILRPAVVWFGESLPKDVVAKAGEFIKAGPIDLMLVIGTFAQVWPAAGFVDDAIEQGARIAMINLDRGNLVPEGGALGLTHRDWFFVGDSAELVPVLLRDAIGGPR